MGCYTKSAIVWQKEVVTGTEDRIEDKEKKKRTKLIKECTKTKAGRRELKFRKGD